METATLERAARVSAVCRGVELSNRLLRAQLAAAGDEDAQTEGPIRLVYLEGRTIYFVLPQPVQHSTARQRSDVARLEQLQQQLLRELGFAPVLEELARV